MMSNFAEFQETMTLTLPNVGGRVEDLFGESATKTKKNSHGIIVELAAIHEGMTSNFNNYRAEELEAALDSWVNPYPKPILINHNLEVDPLGRVMAAKMDKEKDGSVYTRLQIAVTDPAAMARVATQRYLTGSVGGKSAEAICSVCGKDWAEASTVSLPCKHVRGKTYKDVLAYLDRRNLSFKEYSFVNAPADSLSGIRTPDGTEEGADEWVRPARVFDLNMNQQEIVEFEESENRSVLEHMRRKEAAPLYLQLKGAFLTALSADAAGLGLKENSDVSTDEQHEDDEDILALSEGLSSDLAEAADEDPNAAEESEDAEQAQVANEDDNAEEESEEAAEDESTGGEEEASTEELHADENEDGQDNGGQEGELDGDAEEAEFFPQDGGSDRTDHRTEHSPSKGDRRAQGMEVPREKHDPNTYARPMLGDAGTQRRRVETSAVDKSREADGAAQNLEEGEGTDLNEAISVLERRVSELTEHEGALLEENTRLKKALHRTLAERVVDSKIALGMSDASEREVMLEEHAKRTASSLADNLKDLARTTFKRSMDTETFPVMEQKSFASADPNAREVVVIENEEADTDEMNPEDLFTDVLMGRKKL